ncbi:hypothetical protein ACQR1W_21875 [Bradyrhizobium sp. HKCCYLS1011]|uniref:hypothetical protein n=1 Tax=Bradyrhizobium sp. HKCCYLS1011 TaxID=3420733 RepID=UPI003EB7957C
MRKFNKRDMLIFVVCLLLGVALIGWGMAHVIQLKQRLMPSRQTSALIRQGGHQIPALRFASGSVRLDYLPLP